ncbi:MAG: hypothetical protein IKO61_11850 [Lachnospiraceae bacterium]|nr:hypothetical protein [Lachnospiraceae bacterium]
MDENSKKLVRNNTNTTLNNTTTNAQNKVTENKVNEQEILLDFNTVNARLAEENEEAFVNPAVFTEKKKEAKKALLLNNIPVSMPESYINSAGFATAFNTQLSSNKRFFRSDLRGSRLRQKAENATQIIEDTREYSKTCKERSSIARKYARSKLRDFTGDRHLQLSATQEQDIALMVLFMKTGKKASDKDLMRKYASNPEGALMDCVKEYMKIDVTDLKLESDTDFAKSTKTIRSIMDKTEAMRDFIRRHPELVKAAGPEFLEKVEHLKRLSGYCTARGNLLLNNYYITHYNDELSYLAKKDPVEEPEDPKEDTRSEATKKLDKTNRERQKVSNLIYTVEMTSYFFRHGYNEDDNAGEKEFNKLYAKKLSEKEKLSAMDSIVNSSLSLDGGGSGLYGSVLQFVNWLIRSKRRTDFGKPMYEKSVEKLNLLPDSIKDANYQPPLLKQHGVAPDIDLKEYLKDDVKDIMREKLNSAPAPNADPDYKLAYEALKNWTSVRGIVNQDTTRMEMSFSDTFIKASKSWLEKHPEAQNSNDPYEVEQYNFLHNMNEVIRLEMNGKLDQHLGGDYTVDYLKEHLPILKENNTYLKNTEESNVKDIPLFMHGPCLNDIKQSAVGDCWLLGSVQAVVASNPEAIKNMFLDLGDGSVVVRLFQLTDSVTGEPSTQYSYASEHADRFKFKPVFIRLSKDYEESDGYNNDSLWVQLLERAIAASGLNGQHTVKIKNGQVENTTDELTNGSPEIAMSIMTGQFHELKPRRKEVTFNNKDAMTDYHYILSGLPFRIKNEVCEEIDTQRKDNPDFVPAEEYILTLVRRKEQAYKADCDKMLASYSEMQVLIRDFAKSNEKELKNMPPLNFDDILDMIKGNVCYEDIGKFEDFVKGNLNKIAAGGLPEATLRDDLNTNGVVQQCQYLINNVKTAITNKNIAGFKKALIDMGIEIATVSNKLKATGGERDKQLKGILRSVYKDKDEKEALVFKTRHMALKLKYDMKNYNAAQTQTLIELQDALNKSGGGVAVAFNGHCLTALDLKYKDGHWFVLLRDPFNIYNRKYTEKNGRLVCKSQGLGTVFRPSYYKSKRHLIENDDNANIKAGFRGLSWWTFEHFYKECGKGCGFVTTSN